MEGARQIKQQGMDAAEPLLQPVQWASCPPNRPQRLTRAAGGMQVTYATPRFRMYFEIVGQIHSMENIAVGHSIRDLPRLRRLCGRWRKRKGVARVRLPDGFVGEAEVHWYEAARIGRKEIRIKRFLD